MQPPGHENWRLFWFQIQIIARTKSSHKNSDVLEMKFMLFLGACLPAIKVWLLVWPAVPFRGNRKYHCSAQHRHRWMLLKVSLTALHLLQGSWPTFLSVISRDGMCWEKDNLIIVIHQREHIWKVCSQNCQNCETCQKSRNLKSSRTLWNLPEPLPLESPQPLERTAPAPEPQDFPRHWASLWALLRPVRPMHSWQSRGTQDRKPWIGSWECWS